MSGPSGKGKGKYQPQLINDDPKEVKWDDLQNIISGVEAHAEERFGKVYRTMFEGKDVAIKLADASGRPEKLPQFEAEKTYLKQFKDEQRIVQLRGYGEHSEKKDGKVHKEVYLIYKWMETTVNDRIEDLDWKSTRKILIQTAEGLSVLHQAGLVHSDIKPKNLLMDKIRRLWGIKMDGKRRLLGTRAYIHPTD